MNMLEKQQAMREHCIESFNTDNSTYRDYPAVRFMKANAYSPLYVPRGPWDTEDQVPTKQETASLKARMCMIDTVGRPIHPWYGDLMKNVGVVAGRGAYWNWGPNYTVDPIVITRDETPQILLIERSDNGSWAFPGGFLDHPAESTTNASKRECFEETTFDLIVEPEKIIYQGIVADARTTAHAWAYTTARLWRVDTATPVRGEDDALSADWFAIDSLPVKLHGSHAKIIELALMEL